MLNHEHEFGLIRIFASNNPLKFLGYITAMAIALCVLVRLRQILAQGIFVKAVSILWTAAKFFLSLFSYMLCFFTLGCCSVDLVRDAENNASRTATDILKWFATKKDDGPVNFKTLVDFMTDPVSSLLTYIEYCNEDTGFLSIIREHKND